ncbi:unnamed protein product [Vicia faba]|uniref:Uncharacterized protein n=1 Tax=Vicia faba TaxID=3906 RepID=A0AAV0Z3Q7_VICFA|nr:unnamed protein product [Vicia faba]
MVDGNPIDTPVIDNYFDDILNDKYASSEDSNDDTLNDNHQNIEAKFLSKTYLGNNESNKEVRNEYVGDDDIPIAHIMQKLIDDVFEPQDKVTQIKARNMVSVDEEAELDGQHVVKARKIKTKSINKGVKEKEKNVPIKTSLEKYEIVKKKTSQRSHVSKIRKVEEKSIVKKYLKRNLVQSSDYETKVESNVQDIVSTIRRKVGGKRILVNVIAAPLDNVSFHSESSVQKWKFVYQRRISYE